jgi:diguanylate cyclase (GGDEF)-like protein
VVIYHQKSKEKYITLNNNQSALDRIDTLTSCGNFLFFLETLTNRITPPNLSNFSLLLVDINRFSVFNSVRGHMEGDDLLRWISIVLRDTQRPVYRIGGDEFIVVFPEDDKKGIETLASEILDRLNRESTQYKWPNPASVVLTHFSNEKLEIADLWTAIGNALDDAKINSGRSLLVRAYNQTTVGSIYQMRLVINNLATRLLSFANRLDTSNELANLDPITQLPNSIAAERELQGEIEHAQKNSTVFSVLFIDGDNLRFYNDISYAAGDEMIQKLGKTLSDHLRPGDFLARWRVGDEFFILLPNTPYENAIITAERLRFAVETESKSWDIPVSVSIGIADYPVKGASLHELLRSAEFAEKHAKESGKNKVVYL